jgi:hypothetical protein
VTNAIPAILRLQAPALIAFIRSGAAFAAAEWKPLSKGDVMKALFATLFAAMLAAMAVMAHAAPLSPSTALSADHQAPLPSDDDKDKEKDKDKKDG